MILSARFEQALVYSTQVHRDQFRKGSHSPYAAHTLGVASLVLDHGGTEDEAIAALLHDAPEDQGGKERLADIKAKFGAVVAEIVAGCTDAWEDPKPPWRPRKEAYLEHLKTASASVRLVSICDKVHNARSIVADLRIVGASAFNIFKGGKDGTLWYYRSLVTEFKRVSGPEAFTRLVTELEGTVNEIERLAGGNG